MILRTVVLTPLFLWTVSAGAQSLTPPPGSGPRNPFEPPPPATVRIEEVTPVLAGVLTATVMGTTTRLASVRVALRDLRIVAVGDAIGRWRIIDIDVNTLTAETMMNKRLIRSTLRLTPYSYTVAPRNPTAAPALPGASVPSDLPLLPPVPAVPLPSVPLRPEIR